LDQNNYNVIPVSWNKFKRVMYGLAFARTLALKSTISEHYDNPFYVPVFQQQQPSSLALGENYEQLTFNRWVKEEVAALTKNFQNFLSRNNQNVSAVLKWMDGANKARQSYAHNFQQELDELNKIGAKMQKALYFSLVTAASVECASEVMLTCVGLFGGTAIGAMTVEATGGRILLQAAAKAPVMTKAIAGAKFAIAILDGVTVGLCDNWSWGTACDMAVAVKDNTEMNLPGFVSDILDPLLPFISPYFQARAKDAARELAKSKNYGWKRSLKVQSQAASKAAMGTRSVMGTLGKGATVVASGLAMLSIYNSYVKLAERISN